ncbi:MAG TPA: UvrD-helicase domain-containing protein, partial [Chloroflexota bacterium]
MVATDQADRDRLRAELDTTFFVEAGAGTGKTRELVARVVSLVAADSLTMQGLVAITFTEAAAAELRDRIRRELAHAGREEARDIDLAQVQTIHAFAGALLRAFPLEARLPPGFVIWDEMQRDRDFDERFRAWLYDEIPSREDSTRRRAVARALALGLQPERLKMLAHRLQEHYDLLAPGQVWQRAATPDAVEVANASGRALLNLEPLLLYARNAQEDDLVREVRSLAFTAERLADAHAESEAYEALTRYLLRRPTTTRGRVAEWGPHPTHGNAATFIKRTLRSTTEQIEACIGAHRAAAISDLLGYLTDFTLDYAQDRKYRGVATFHDLLVWARDLLRDHPLARGIASARIQRLFVDEFQDTDPLQAELIVYLCADPTLSGERDWRALLDHLTPGKLFVVGDPKQSIYRFRRAEVAVYQRVYQASASAGAARASLAQTFRSVGPIVAWLNEFFSSVMRRDQGVQAEYTRLAARPALDGFEVDDERCGVRVMGGADDRGAGERWTAEADAIARVARKAVAEAWPVTEQIDDNWRARPCQFKDICVLLPTRTNLRRLERAFEANGVPYRMESGSLVVFTQEVRDLIACARAIEDPSDQVALVAALRSPAYACSDVDLLAWVEAGGYLSYLSPGIELDGVVGRAMASLSDFHRQRSERSAAATIEALIRDRALGLQAMGHPRPREALRRQRYVVAQARKLASAGDPTLRGFVHWIETLRKNELYDAESAVPDSDEDAVRLMTVHGSKGLEFPIVILSGLGGGVRSNDGVQLLASHTSGHIEARLTARVGPA